MTEDIKPGNIEPVDSKVRIQFDKGDFELSSELEVTTTTVELGRPGRDEWFAAYIPRLTNEAGDGVAATITMAVFTTPGDYGEKQFYYIDDADIRRELRRRCKSVRVVFTRCMRSGLFRVWLVPVTTGNSYYESLVPFLNLDSEILTSQEWAVEADTDASVYVVRHSKIRRQVDWPDYSESDVADLVLKAIGESNFISDRSHEFYERVTSGNILK